LDIKAIRENIPALKETIYLNCGWSGPSPRPVVERIIRRLEYESYYGPTSPPVLESNYAVTTRTREAIAQFLGASSEEIALTQNTTEGLNLVLNGLSWREGDEVITCDLEHPSVLVPAYFLQSRHGVKVKVLRIGPTEDEGSILTKIQDALSQRTRLIFFSHIQYSCGLCMPLRDIQALARDRGVLVLWDGAQTMGQIPLNMREMGCDFYSVAGQKWLLGPDGTGALFIRKDLIPQVQPSRLRRYAARSFDLEGHLEVDYQAITKYEIGASNSALWEGMTAAMEFQEGLGRENIERASRERAQQLKDLLAELPKVTLLSPSDPSISCGLVTFAVEGIENEEAVKRLWEESKIVVRAIDYPKGIRASVAFYNTKEEIAQTVEVLSRL